MRHRLIRPSSSTEGNFWRGLSRRHRSSNIGSSLSGKDWRTLLQRSWSKLLPADLPETTVKRALELGRQLINRDRLREPVYRALMRMLARQRDRAEAMKVYAKCRDALMEELGVAPELETEQLYRDILTDRQARTCCPWVNPGRGRRNSGAAIAGSCAVQQYQRRSSIDPAM